MASDDENVSVSELRKRFEQKSQSTAPVYTKPAKPVQPTQRVQPMQRVQPSERTQPLKEVEPSQLVEPSKEVKTQTCRDSMTSDSVTNNELRLVLIGITGSGKSASANTILGDKPFRSEVSASSITATCKVEHKTRFGHDIVIVDTPGAFDTERSHGEIAKEIIQCITMCAPGPHAFIMVVQAKRFTREEQHTIEYFEDLFGKALFDYLFLLFTRVDDLEEDGKNLEGFLYTAPKNLKTLISACGGRYVGFNNREKDEKKKEKMVCDLIDMIQENMKKNNGEYYKSELLEAAEKEVKKREEIILKENEKEMQKEREKIKEEYREKMEKRAMEAKENKEKILKENGKEMRKFEKKVLKQKEEKIRKLENIVNEKEREKERQRIEKKFQEENLRKHNEMEKTEEMFKMREKRKQQDIEKGRERSLRKKEEEQRRRARNEVRKEAETNKSLLDSVASAVQALYSKKPQ